MTLVSAPGKILLGGEYAVLLGAEAVVTAVDRRAFATFLPHAPKGTSVVVHSVMKTARSFLKKRGISMNPDAWVSVQSSGFCIGKLKLGLGSSSAVAASAAGAVLEANGLPVEDHLEDILQTAQDAHFAAQDGRGSGVDVAAGVTGGTLLYTMSRPPVPVSLNGLYIAAVFSGRSVSTSEMLGSLGDFEKKDSRGYDDCMSDLVACAGKLAEAYRCGLPRKIIGASKAYGESMDRLGRAAGTAIVTNEHRCVMTLAEEAGGAAKPSGAGGGDIAVAFFDSEDALHAFRMQCIRHELTPLNLKMNAPGVKLESS